MCGFFGWVSPTRALSEGERQQARRALGKLAHRGPDGQGEWADEFTCLGHRRLKIIDLSDEANQPFLSADQRYVVVFNGEIYNYLELRQELAALGWSFRTSSDTEVLLAAWQQWGEAAFRRFDGMFAAGIHDRETRRHVLVRDHLGQKPLYWHWDSDGLVYASELSALLALERPWRLDRPSFLRYLSQSYYSGEDSPLAGVQKLLPGCYLTLTPGQTPQTSRYWESRPGDAGRIHAMDDAVAEFERLFNQSCAISLRSDVPQGVFLSGGIDSTLVAAACASLRPDLRTYSVAMGERDYDEREKAAIVTRHLGLRHHTVVEMNDVSVQSSIVDFLSGLGEPHGDPGYVNTLFLARAVRQDITVALAGDGADELFYGYAPFQGVSASRAMAALPAPAVGMIKAAARLLPRGSDGYLSLAFKVDAYLQGFPAPATTRHANWLSTLPPERLARLCPWTPTGHFARCGSPNTIFEPIAGLLAPLAGATPDQLLAYFYQKVFLPEFVCLHTDRAAMQASLEVRAPFLSVPLIEFANALPDGLKRKGGTLKALLREALRRRGFPETIWAQKKQGFTFPLARYLKGALRPQLDALRADTSGLGGLVDPIALGELIDDHLAGRANNYRILFNLIAFRAWLGRFPHIQCQ